MKTKIPATETVRPYSGGGCRPSRVVGSDGEKRKNIIPKVEYRGVDVLYGTLGSFSLMRTQYISVLKLNWEYCAYRFILIKT